MQGPIYAITDENLLPGDRLGCGVLQALEGGVNVVQLRNKSASTEQLIRNAHQLLGLCESHGAKLIINDRVDVAAEVGAHGVHLGQEDGDVAQARRILGTNAIIGVTCHNDLDLATRAQNQGASYVAFGRFFPSSTKPLAKPATTNLIAAAKALLQVPVVVIGGINLDNMAPLVHNGADHLAICHNLFASDNIQSQAQALIQRFFYIQQQTESL